MESTPQFEIPASCPALCQQLANNLNGGARSLDRGIAASTAASEQLTEAIAKRDPHSEDPLVDELIAFAAEVDTSTYNRLVELSAVTGSVALQVNAMPPCAFGGCKMKKASQLVRELL